MCSWRLNLVFTLPQEIRKMCLRNECPEPECLIGTQEQRVDC